MPYAYAPGVRKSHPAPIVSLLVFVHYFPGNRSVGPGKVSSFDVIWCLFGWTKTIRLGKQPDTENILVNPQYLLRFLISPFGFDAQQTGTTCEDNGEDNA